MELAFKPANVSTLKNRWVALEQKEILIATLSRYTDLSQQHKHPDVPLMSELALSAPQLRVVAHTDLGQRSHNEDAFLVNKDLGLMLVADGVGGHHAGEVASEITCRVIERELMAGASLEKSIRVANKEVVEAVARKGGRSGMASTIVALKFDGLSWELAWVGDSRAYLWDGKLGLLSQDQSLVETLVQSGEISLEEARNHPQKNVINQAIGLQASDKLCIGSNRGQLLPGQLMLMCSDGLNDVLDSARIVEILSSEGDLDTRCQQLLQSVLDAGGHDNATAVLLEAGADIPDDVSNTIAPHFTWVYDPVSGTYSGLPETSSAISSESVGKQAPEEMAIPPVPPPVPTTANPSASGRDNPNKQGADLKYLWLGAAVLALTPGLLLRQRCCRGWTI